MGVGLWEGQNQMKEFKYTIMHKINKLQEYNVQHREYTQFTVTLNIIYKNIELLCSPETNIMLLSQIYFDKK